jgi:DNA-binding NarL/FixJ family response regulator
MIKILVADDHALIREGVRTLLQDEKDLKIFSDVKTGNDVLPSIEKNKPDIIILDISMPGRSGLDLIKDIKQRGFNTPVLFLTMHPEKRYALRAFRAGAAGYLTKESAPDELVKAIRKIIAGGRYVTDRFAEELANDLQSEERNAPHESLSDREFQVLLMIASGKTAREIATELSLGEATVYTYRDRVLQKMELQTTAELTRYALERGLIE